MSSLGNRIKQKLSDSYFLYKHTRYLRNLIADSTREDAYMEVVHNRFAMKQLPKDKDRIVIAFYPTGGFGDYIISSKLLDELLIKAAPCRIDVYCENMTYGIAVYGNRPAVLVQPYACYEGNKTAYDLALRVEHFVHVQECNAYKIARISPEFMDTVEQLGRSMGSIRPDIGQQCYREAIHFKRCELKGINRWTELRHENIFEVSDRWTYVSMKKEYQTRFEKLGLSGKKYITINRGADSMGRSSIQTKVWPKRRYEEFVKCFHQQYPEIEIIQLGSKKNTKIEGVNQYILEESLETIKWILKDSILHLDCEGGLVHLGTQLGTKCVVLFGPTPYHFYSYPQNINLVSEKCSDCMGTHADWAFSCYRGMREPECMYGITADMVLKRIETYMKNVTQGETEKRLSEMKAEGFEKRMTDLEWRKRWEKYQKKNPYAEIKQEYIEDYKKIASVLDESCQKYKIALINMKRDFLGSYLHSCGHEVTLFDRDYGYSKGDEKFSFEHYMKLEKKQGVDVRFGDFYNIPYSSDQFDFVIYQGEEEMREQEIRRILKTEGRYFKMRGRTQESSNEQNGEKTSPN